ncbi:hypothetical protein FQN57_002812 [Myotisia sp. PD_48]|nr:hypothetical protein FQN57_002812 [Myotisia sp. PD_48]
MGRQQEAEKALHDQTNILPKTQVLIVFVALAFALMICVIDQNALGVSLPTIGKDLRGENTITWAGTANMIGNTIFIVLYGRLSDIFGRKRVFVVSLVILCLADVGCSVANSAPLFYVFRGLAGVGNGGIVSLTTIIVSDVVTLQDRGKYQGILGFFVGVGNIIGPFLVAAFIQNETWRAFFYMLSPAALACAAISWWLLPDNIKSEALLPNLKRIDYYGVIASSAGILLLLIPISGGGSYFSWNSPMVISMLVLGAVAMLVFVFVEFKVAVLPMMPMYQTYLYYLPIYFQNVRLWDPMKSATLLIPIVAGQAIGSITSGNYISWRSSYGAVLWTGFGLWTLGAGLTILFDRETPEWQIVVSLSLVGLGVGHVFQPTIIAIQAHSPKSYRAVVISNRNFYRCLGSSTGLAVSAALLQVVLKSNLPAAYSHLANSTYVVPNNLPVEDMDSVLGAYMKASHAVFILQAPLIGLGFLGCALVPDRGLERPPEPGEESEELEEAEGQPGSGAQRAEGSYAMQSKSQDVERQLTRERSRHEPAAV